MLITPTLILFHRSSTRSLLEQELDYVEEHGRRYCGSYYLPNDELEQDRMRIIHRVYLHVFEGELTSVPLEQPQRILDVGTGIGEWAIAMADQWPTAEVIGTDISALAPTAVPINAYFEIDDAELEWERHPDSFDLVHMRNMAGSFKDWDFIYRQAYKVLRPDGFIELLDFDDQGGFRRFLSEFPPGSDMHLLARDLAIAAAKSGRARGVTHLDPRLLMEAGFVDVKLSEHIIPINTDAAGGRMWLIACVDGLEAVCLRLLTKYMDWDPEHVKKSCFTVATEMARIAKDPVKSKGLNIKVRVIVGKKPSPEPPSVIEEESAVEQSSTSEDEPAEKENESKDSEVNGEPVAKVNGVNHDIVMESKQSF
jgi:SAM-dependent methyltransferase